MIPDIRLFPTLSDELMEKISFKQTAVSFFYTDSEDEEHDLETEELESSDIVRVRDRKGIWTVDEYNIGIKQSYSIAGFNHLFGSNGLVCSNSQIGLAVRWLSSDSKQRGVIPVVKAGEKDSDVEAEVSKLFSKAQLRGDVTFETILYIAEGGSPTPEEQHLANTEGYILGILSRFVLRLDGRGSVFPIYENMKKGEPLWEVKCDWNDPTTDLFEDTVSVNLNKLHKNYKFIDRTQKTFNEQLFIEIMSSALVVIIEELRKSGYWEQIISNDSLREGSVGQAIFYFKDCLGWDLSSSSSISHDARLYFDKRM